MKRSNTQSMLGHANFTTYKQRVAYHEAGHAVAIHLNHGERKLPPVFYQIILNSLDTNVLNPGAKSYNGKGAFSARIKGGRLIQSLTLPFNDAVRRSPAYNDALVFRFTEDYRLAFEADILNILVGSLAEAKFTALQDNEPFILQLLTEKSLHYYGGESDLRTVKEYLRSYSADIQVQRDVLTQFIERAFHFVNTKTYWKAITKLANYLLASDKRVICCEEVAALLAD